MFTEKKVHTDRFLHILHYENPKHKNAWAKPGEGAPSQLKRDIHCDKFMLCIWSEIMTGDITDDPIHTYIILSIMGLELTK